MNRGWGRALFWVGVILGLAIIFYVLSPILLPFLVGAAFAFFLNPLVRRLERWRVNRSLAATLVLGMAVLTLIVFAVLLAPLLETQVVQLVQHFPTYVDAGRHQLDSMFQLLQDSLSPQDLDRLQDAASAKINDLLGGAGAVISRVLTGGLAVANILSLCIITPIVTFFLMRDWDLAIGTLDSWMPRQYVGTIREQVGLIDEALSGFIRGQATVCLLLGALYAIGLTLLGLDFGVVIGFCVGLLIFIPFIGGFTGALVAIGIAFAQFGDWHRPLYIAIMFVVGQALEGNVITPKLVGDRVHLHPVWIIFSLLAFGSLFGFAGVLIAVPMAAVLGVLMRFALKCYLSSALYDPTNGSRLDPTL